MRFTVELEGRPQVVEVAEDLATVRVGERTFPVKVVARAPLRVDLEIGGEVVAVVGWPEHSPTPPGPVDVNGERYRVGVRSEGGASHPPTARAPTGRPSAAPASGGAPVAAAASEIPGATAIVPPMPGRVVELKVKDGEVVAAGAVLLVLEAMKMRNEVTAPVAGVVRELHVREGTNVRAHETMLVIAPKPA